MKRLNYSKPAGLFFKYIFIHIFLGIFVYCTAPALASELTVSTVNDEKEPFDSITSTIERRDALEYDPTRLSFLPDAFSKLRSWRTKIKKDTRFETTLSYNTLGQYYIDSDDNQKGSAGDLTLSSRWQIFGGKYDRPVYLSFRLRYRHAFGRYAPSELNAQKGLIWKTVDGFTDAGFQIPELYFSHKLPDKGLTLRYGQLSIKSFFDNHKLRSAKRYFLNQVFSANPSISFPSYGAGFILQWNRTENWDFTVGGSNIQSTDGSKEVDLHLDSSALFYSAQAGYNFKGFANRGARIQLMGWQSENNEKEIANDGNGLSLTMGHEGLSSGEYFIARVAFSSGNAASADRLLMLGWGKEIRKFDHFGIGFSLGRSSIDSKTWQGASEVYYRWQVTQEFAVTPDFQLILGDGPSDNEAVQFVFGIRIGIAL